MIKPIGNSHNLMPTNVMYHLRNKDNRTVLMYDNITRAKEQALSRNLTLVEVTSYDCVLMERVDKGAISDGR